ncbi:hypothetical protein BAY06_13755 [Elizabethkingia anophelis]|nr:hypothetical protein [Elizabethkingia anophelis]OPC53935.1 hypothetical protein BAY06_13755 [Elizabethkingia anophelis]
MGFADQLYKRNIISTTLKQKCKYNYINTKANTVVIISFLIYFAKLFKKINSQNNSPVSEY